MTQTSTAAAALPTARPVKFVMTEAKEDEFRRRWNFAMARLAQ